MASEPTLRGSTAAEAAITKVKVSKIAVWNVNGVLIEDVKAATSETRRLVIQELIEEQSQQFDQPLNDVPFWTADNWERIEARVARAMAGT